MWENDGKEYIWQSRANLNGKEIGSFFCCDRLHKEAGACHFNVQRDPSHVYKQNI